MHITMQMSMEKWALPQSGDTSQNLSSVTYLTHLSTLVAGMDFYVVLERPGYRVGRRRRAVSTVGIQHKVTKEDAQKW